MAAPTQGDNDTMSPPSTNLDPSQLMQNKSIYDIMMTSQLHRNQSQHFPSAIQPDFYYSYEKALAAKPGDTSPALSSSSKPSDTTSTGLRKLSYLPYHLPWRPIAGPAETPVDFNWLTESCGAKAAIGVFGGGVMGLLMGVFLGAMSDMTPPVTIINGKDVPQAPMKEQMRMTLRATAEKSRYWCRNFAFITGVFSGSECLVEKARGTHDVWNEVISGCVTGAAIQAKSGPQAAAMGCGGFAAFSLIIAQVMGTH